MNLAYAENSQETNCKLSLSEQVTNISLLKKYQNQLIVKMQESDWLPKELVTEVKRTNEETFVGVDNLLLRRNQLAIKKDWATCDSPDFKYTSFEVYALVNLAQQNINAIDTTNKYRNQIMEQSKCSTALSCNQSLFTTFRNYQKEYSWQILESIEEKKQQTIAQNIALKQKKSNTKQWVR